MPHQDRALPTEPLLERPATAHAKGAGPVSHGRPEDSDTVVRLRDGTRRETPREAADHSVPVGHERREPPPEARGQPPTAPSCLWRGRQRGPPCHSGRPRAAANHCLQVGDDLTCPPFTHLLPPCYLKGVSSEKKQTQLRLEPTVLAAGKNAAAARGLDFNRYIERLIAEDTSGARAAGMAAAQRLIDAHGDFLDNLEADLDGQHAPAPSTRDAAA